ncbi:MAG TPA: OPT/YSL family transporter, partial [Polyangia bacterium]|nr:OPT/YSL family transporter [Polyangia bacterium]
MPEPAAAAPYREVTTAALVLGIVVGIILTASFTYAGLIIGFTVPASAVAAIIGWGVLRGLLKRGSIVENNINQTVAAGINITCSGVIFTLPALFLLGRSFNVWPIALAAVAGGFLGVLFIIPLRKQMVELDRLRFPTGFATATILRSPGAGVRKTVLLLAGTGFAFVFAVLVQRPALGLSPWIPETIDLGRLMHLPPYVANVWALSLLSVGAGFISGRAGLVVLAGGVLANWVVAPALVYLG